MSLVQQNSSIELGSSEDVMTSLGQILTLIEQDISIIPVNIRGVMKQKVDKSIDLVQRYSINPTKKLGVKMKKEIELVFAILSLVEGNENEDQNNSKRLVNKMITKKKINNLLQLLKRYQRNPTPELHSEVEQEADIIFAFLDLVGDRRDRAALFAT